MFYLAFEEFVESAELEETGALPEEIGGLNSVDLVEHGVVIDGYFFVDEAEEIIRDIGLAK